MALVLVAAGDEGAERKARSWSWSAARQRASSRLDLERLARDEDDPESSLHSGGG